MFATALDIAGHVTQRSVFFGRKVGPLLICRVKVTLSPYQETTRHASTCRAFCRPHLRRYRFCSFSIRKERYALEANGHRRNADGVPIFRFANMVALCHWLRTVCRTLHLSRLTSDSQYSQRNNPVAVTTLLGERPPPGKTFPPPRNDHCDPPVANRLRCLVSVSNGGRKMASSPIAGRYEQR